MVKKRGLRKNYKESVEAVIHENIQVDFYNLRSHLSRLQNAVAKKRTKKWCLQLWSRFIRERDGFRCVNCDDTSGIQAHHIFRRVICPIGTFEIGNGITLCKKCHRKVHEVFNGRPDIDEPLNKRGGDDPDYIAYLYGILGRVW